MKFEFQLNELEKDNRENVSKHKKRFIMTLALVFIGVYLSIKTTNPIAFIMFGVFSYICYGSYKTYKKSSINMQSIIDSNYVIFNDNSLELSLSNNPFTTLEILTNYYNIKGIDKLSFVVEYSNITKVQSSFKNINHRFGKGGDNSDYIYGFNVFANEIKIYDKQGNLLPHKLDSFWIPVSIFNDNLMTTLKDKFNHVFFEEVSLLKFHKAKSNSIDFILDDTLFEEAFLHSN